MHTNRKYFAAVLPRRERACAVGQRGATGASQPLLLRVACIDGRGVVGVDVCIMMVRREVVLFSDLLERLARSSSSAGGRDNASSVVRLQGTPSMAMLVVSWGLGTAVSLTFSVSCPRSPAPYWVYFRLSVELHGGDCRLSPLADGSTTLPRRNAGQCSTSATVSERGKIASRVGLMSELLQLPWQ